MSAGGTVRVGVRNISNEAEAVPTLKPGNYVLITIADSGQGIAAEHIKKIFDPYYTTKKQGSGLGLATSFSIVKQHGGIIEVQSEAGVGSTFFIYLPASGKNMAMAAEGEISPRTGGGKILVMDDDEMVRTLAARMIAKLGYGVEFAVNGEEALAKYAQAREAGRAYDVVILDLTIKGGMGGKETIARLVALDPGVRAMVSSGYSDDQVMANFREHGFQAALAKPFTMAKLSKTLQDLMA
jgi:CheY-like chemotaxis protein